MHEALVITAVLAWMLVVVILLRRLVKPLRRKNPSLRLIKPQARRR